MLRLPKPARLEPVLYSREATNEKPMHHNKEQLLTRHNKRNPPQKQQRAAAAKNKYIINIFKSKKIKYLFNKRPPVRLFMSWPSSSSSSSLQTSRWNLKFTHHFYTSISLHTCPTKPSLLLRKKLRFMEAEGLA